MSERKIVFLQRGEIINHKALLHQILEEEGVEAVAVVVRIDGRWHTCYGGDVTGAGLSMAALKLLHDVSHDNEAT